MTDVHIKPCTRLLNVIKLKRQKRVWYLNTDKSNAKQRTFEYLMYLGNLVRCASSVATIFTRLSTGSYYIYKLNFHFLQ